jgi:hypothetical protein
MNDRNNFLVDVNDQKIFKQMPIDCQRQIYTDFVFQEFLFKFRRFVSFRIAEIKQKSTFDKKTKPTIVNKNLQKLKRLISTVVTCIILMKPNKNKVKMTRQEVEELTEHYRRRVADIEKRKKVEMLEIS